MSGIGELVDVDPLDFETVEPALDHDVVRPATLPVHALANTETLQQNLVLRTGKLASWPELRIAGSPKRSVPVWTAARPHKLHRAA